MCIFLHRFLCQICAKIFTRFLILTVRKLSRSAQTNHQKSTYLRQKDHRERNLDGLSIVGVTRFELATPWSQTRCSSQTEPHPETLFSSDLDTILNSDKVVNQFLIFFSCWFRQGEQFRRVFFLIQLLFWSVYLGASSRLPAHPREHLLSTYISAHPMQANKKSVPVFGQALVMLYQNSLN